MRTAHEADIGIGLHMTAGFAAPTGDACRAEVGPVRPLRLILQFHDFSEPLEFYTVHAI